MIGLLRALLLGAIFAPLPLFAQEADDPPIERLRLEILEKYPHDPAAFTQGLLWHEGLLYESIGRYNQSALRQVDLPDGEVLRELSLRRYPLFAEGLALAGERLWQLTWREQLALRYNLAAFAGDALLEIEQFAYEGEGWGLCFDGQFLVMSDGSDTLQLRDAQDFALLDTRQVTMNGVPLGELAWDAGQALVVDAPRAEDEEESLWRLELLNELECVGTLVYANVWQSDLLLAIEGTSGVVRAIIVAEGLLTEEERAAADVLNGIAWLPERETFLLTGKLWPWVFEVRFVAAESGA